MSIRLYCFLQLYLSVLSSAGIIFHSDFIKRSEILPQENKIIVLPPKMLASFKDVFENSFRQAQQSSKHYTNGFFSQDDICYACKVSYPTAENNTINTAYITQTSPPTNTSSKNMDVSRYIIIPYNNTLLSRRPDVICSHYNESDGGGKPRVESIESMDEWRKVRDLFMYSIFGTILVSVVVIILLAIVLWKCKGKEDISEKPEKQRSKYNIFTHQTSTITTFTQISSCPFSPSDDTRSSLKTADMEECDEEKKLEKELVNELEVNEFGGDVKYENVECVNTSVITFGDDPDENFVDTERAVDKINEVIISEKNAKHSDEVLSHTGIYNKSQEDTLERDSKKSIGQTEITETTSKTDIQETCEKSTKNKTEKDKNVFPSNIKPNDTAENNKIKPKIPPKTLAKTWKKVQQGPADEQNFTEKNGETSEDAFQQSFKITLPYKQHHKIILEAFRNPENYAC